MIKRPQVKKYPTYWSEWIGKFAIRLCGDCAPEIVFIERVNSMGCLTGSSLNTSYMLIAKPNQLVEYTPRLFRKLECNQKYKEHVKQSKLWKDRILKQANLGNS